MNTTVWVGLDAVRGQFSIPAASCVLQSMPFAGRTLRGIRWAWEVVQPTLLSRLHCFTVEVRRTQVRKTSAKPELASVSWLKFNHVSPRILGWTERTKEKLVELGYPHLMQKDNGAMWLVITIYPNYLCAQANYFFFFFGLTPYNSESLESWPLDCHRIPSNYFFNGNCGSPYC